jgi:hypothetical protein
MSLGVKGLKILLPVVVDSFYQLLTGQYAIWGSGCAAQIAHKFSSRWE